METKDVSAIVVLYTSGHRNSTKMRGVSAKIILFIYFWVRKALGLWFEGVGLIIDCVRVDPCRPVS